MRPALSSRSSFCPIVASLNLLGRVTIKTKTARFGPRRREDMMRRFDATRSSLIHALLIAAAIGAATTLAAAQSAKQTVTVYTSLQKELLAPYEAAFRKAHPDPDRVGARCHRHPACAVAGRA